MLITRMKQTTDNLCYGQENVISSPLIKDLACSKHMELVRYGMRIALNFMSSSQYHVTKTTSRVNTETKLSQVRVERRRDELPLAMRS